MMKKVVGLMATLGIVLSCSSVFAGTPEYRMKPTPPEYRPPVLPPEKKPRPTPPEYRILPHPYNGR